MMVKARRVKTHVHMAEQKARKLFIWKKIICRAHCYKTFYGYCLSIFLINLSVFLWQVFKNYGRKKLCNNWP